MTVKVKNFDYEAIKRALITAGKIVQGDAKLLAPVDTGRLRGSISMATYDTPANVDGAAMPTDGVSQPDNENIIKIGTNVEYAAFVEYGNGGIYAYLRRALIQNRERIKKVFAFILNEGKK